MGSAHFKVCVKSQSLGSSSTHVPNSAGTDHGQVTVAHLLKKHRDSRRPSSWRYEPLSSIIVSTPIKNNSCETITISKEEAVEQLQAIRDQIARENAENGFQYMKALFNQLASVESDCSSARNGGEMDAFGPGSSPSHEIPHTPTHTSPHIQ